MPDSGSINRDITNQIATITFHHPKGNSMPGEMLRNLAETIIDMGKTEDAPVIIIKSDGDGAFCGGAFFDELLEISNFDEGKHFFMGFAHVINAMRKCPKLIIARVQGKTVGGGVGIAAAADHTLAHNSAGIKLSELALGIGPFVVGPAVRRKIGETNFSTLAIDATQWYNAVWAHNKGLYAHIFETHKELDNAVNELATNLSQYNPEAMKELKKVFWRGTDHWDTLLEQRAEISGRLVLSDYTRIFIQKFKEKS
ncbi:enoyl-CoA hydratase/isomerase family protein [Aliifodinibius sp. S!AR15-10]|uniref:enoyl-CoA hydratase/isomerase family protein n=1 Tax=Aliifodinibius sp. S!AR15-10 TaxID=2950437 RepID=UPI0028669F93|nr:enoyl-CoA hydratase/isomerase family protein [Aliifodinibius sp. S!AR15-10]MDR8393312.1 enoyl-CoA hydratase/isomerase family protein [Aliifodinibius sp. S!AR15-10]